MNFLAPLAFALTALLPIIVALYFLKLRREEQRVSSTYLWRTLVRDTAANAPWQRLKPNLLLLLQLLILIALIIALARPFTWSDSTASSHLIIVLDTSPSMSATDVKPSRLAEAVATAQRLMAGLPTSSHATLITAGSQSPNLSISTVPVSNFQSLISTGDFASALTMAAALAAREADSEVAILSDSHVTLPPNFTLPSRVRFIPIGSGDNNQAIGAFSVQGDAGGRSLSGFVQVVNYGSSAARRRLSLYADGRLWTARELTLLPNQSQAITLADLPANARTLEAQLEGDDLLALDDRAWAVPPSNAAISVRLISAGNRFLETALRLMPNVELTVHNPISDTQLPTSNLQLPTSNIQLTIFDSFVPTDTLPSGNLLFIAPPRSTDVFTLTGRIDAPVSAPVVADDPLLRYVDLRDVLVQDAARVSLPAWGRAVIVDSKSGSPLLIVGEDGGRRIALLAFDLRRSDLPLRVAFPILLANLLDFLAPGSAAGIPSNVEPGRPLSIVVPPQASAVSLRAPDGQQYRITPQDGRAVFAQTNQLGVYEVSFEASTAAPTRFTVNLFDANESNITPRHTLQIADCKLQIADCSNQSTISHQPSANEWWLQLAWLAFALLVAEWLYAYRGSVARVLESVPHVVSRVRPALNRATTK